MIVWRAPLWVITAIQPRSRQDWFLEPLVVFSYGVPIVFTYQSFRFSKSLLRLVHGLPGLASERRTQFGELLMRASGVKRGRSYLLALTVVLGFSGIYDVVEGVLAEIVAPNLGRRWLGT